MNIKLDSDAHALAMQITSATVSDTANVLKFTWLISVLLWILNLPSVASNEPFNLEGA